MKSRVLFTTCGSGRGVLPLPSELCCTGDEILQPSQDRGEKIKKIQVELDPEKYFWMLQPNGKKSSAAGMLGNLFPAATPKLFLGSRDSAVFN